MSLGMSWRDYWYGDVRMARDYIEAERLRRRQRNWEMWMQGLYGHHAAALAIRNAFRKKGEEPEPYPEEPFPLWQEPQQPETPMERERRERNEEQFARAYMMQMDLAGRRWGKEEGGGTDGRRAGGG